MLLRALTASAIILLVPRLVRAEDVFSHESGVAIATGGAVGMNSDDMAVDYAGNHAMASLNVGYRARFGTEPFLTVGVGLGGHEAVFQTYGAGIRQRFRLGRVEPFVELGIHEVGDEAGLPLAMGGGAGVDLRLGERWFTGATVRHFFSSDSDELGGLDWSGQVQLGVRL